MKKVILISVIATSIISLLFYRSVWGGVVFPLCFWGFYKREKREGKLRQDSALQNEFVNGIKVLNTALQAGMAMENAWHEVEKETELMYGKESLFYQEVKEIQHAVSLNMPIEKVLLEFAYRSGIPDIMSFAEVFAYGKRSGGNWKKIIDTTVFRIQGKHETKKEIEVMIAAKKLEQQVMNIMPLGVLFFLQISSWDYMSVLYHNPMGICFMTCCLMGYGASIALSEKILQIQV